jgi:dTDP-glucose pyrophosphorylase
MWGIVPAAGVGGTNQPASSRRDARGERPHGAGGARGTVEATGEHLIDRMAAAGVTRLCFVIAQGEGDDAPPPSERDLVARHGAVARGVPTFYAVQPRPLGVCDAIFRVLPLVRPEEQAVVALPDTLWFPARAMRALGDGGLSFLCFPVAEPERFEAVVASEDGEVREIRVRRADPGSRWIWGAFKLDGATLRALHELWVERGRTDASIGALVNAWIERGGAARAVRAGEIYVDVSTPSGRIEAEKLLGRG